MEWNYTLMRESSFALIQKTSPTIMTIAVVTLQGFVLGKLALLTVFLGKLKFASVSDFSLSKLPRESFIAWGLKTAREQKNVLWISLDNYQRCHPLGI